MILQCSNCNARFLVPDSAIGATGRTVRCARCAHTWLAMPPSPTPASIDEKLAKKIPELEEMIATVNSGSEEIKPKPLAAGSNLPVRRKPKASATLKASVFIAACFAILMGMFIKMPELFGVYPSVGAVLSDVKFTKRSEEKDNLVEISGNITNETDAEISIPTIRIILLNAQNSPLETREYSGGGKTLKPKETIPFATGEMKMKYSTANKFVVDLGTQMELALRRKPN